MEAALLLVDDRKAATATEPAERLWWWGVIHAPGVPRVTANAWARRHGRPHGQEGATVVPETL
jgi:hypothetical protein